MKQIYFSINYVDGHFLFGEKCQTLNSGPSNKV